MMSFEDYRDWGGKGGVSTRQWCVRSAPKSPDVADGRLVFRDSSAVSTTKPHQAMPPGILMPPPACSWGDALSKSPALEVMPSDVQQGEVSAFTRQCSAGSASSPVLPVRRILSLCSELGWKELQLVCRQLGYLCVCILWTVCDCRVPLFYLIVCLEASSDLIMPTVVSLGLSCMPSGIAWAGPAVHMLAHSWANRDWQWVSGFLRLRSLLRC